MRIMSVVGARPQFVKASPVSRALREAGHEEILVHSGQHYDRGMSDVFFDQLGVPQPDYNLGVGSSSHGRMTGAMLGLLEELFIETGPDLVLVYGDTNTTLAAGLAAAKLVVPVAHVEAGLRSFDRAMPEEVNRVVVDHLSQLLLCPTDVSAGNLAAEGITEGVHVVGDVMIDTLRVFAERADVEAATQAHAVVPDNYYLATVHRASNTDDPAALARIIEAFTALGEPVLWAVHPRTRARLETDPALARLIEAAANVHAIEPQPYLETVALLRGTRALLTDSGGMQKEAYFLGVPCVTLRDETEWVETVDLGWNTLVGTDAARIVAAARLAARPEERPAVYGDGYAAERIAEVIAATA